MSQVHVVFEIHRFVNLNKLVRFSLVHCGYYMYRQFNIQQFYVLLTQYIYLFCIYLRTNSDFCHLQDKLIGFYNRNGECLLRGTDWVFKYV
jgi:hypothetical protein